MSWFVSICVGRNFDFVPMICQVIVLISFFGVATAVHEHIKWHNIQPEWSEWTSKRNTREMSIREVTKDLRKIAQCKSIRVESTLHCYILSLSCFYRNLFRPPYLCIWLDWSWKMVWIDHFFENLMAQFSQYLVILK